MSVWSIFGGGVLVFLWVCVHILPIIHKVELILTWYPAWNQQLAPENQWLVQTNETSFWGPANLQGVVILSWRIQEYRCIWVNGCKLAEFSVILGSLSVLVTASNGIFGSHAPTSWTLSVHLLTFPTIVAPQISPRRVVIYLVTKLLHTVDGRNPAPHGMYINWCRISSINSIAPKLGRPLSCNVTVTIFWVRWVSRILQSLLSFKFYGWKWNSHGGVLHSLW